MHIHLSALTVITVFASVIIAGFFWRMASMSLADSALGQAMAFLY